MSERSTPRTSGRAFRVSLLGQEQIEAYPNVHVEIDAQHPVVHIFSADGSVHHLTIPLARALIEWEDPSGLQPQIRMPPFGAGVFEQMGEQMQRMIEGMQQGMGWADPERP